MLGEDGSAPAIQCPVPHGKAIGKSQGGFQLMDCI
jgi:hypothetical protein